MSDILTSCNVTASTSTTLNIPLKFRPIIINYCQRELYEKFKSLGFLIIISLRSSLHSLVYFEYSLLMNPRFQINFCKIFTKHSILLSICQFNPFAPNAPFLYPLRNVRKLVHWKKNELTRRPLKNNRRISVNKLSREVFKLFQSPILAQELEKKIVIYSF